MSGSLEIDQPVQAAWSVWRHADHPGHEWFDAQVISRINDERYMVRSATPQGRIVTVPMHRNALRVPQ